jgi:uncharacterized protein (TIGR02996 family)
MAKASREEQGFRRALAENPDDRAALNAYVDWLREHGRHLDAAKALKKAGLGVVLYAVRQKSTGRIWKTYWSNLPQAREFIRLVSLAGPVARDYYGPHYTIVHEMLQRNVQPEDLEAVVLFAGPDSAVANVGVPPGHAGADAAPAREPDPGAVRCAGGQGRRERPGGRAGPAGPRPCRRERPARNAPQ